MFEGTITYNVVREFYGKTYHLNFKKLVCFISTDYYKEEFWADKKNKYFVRIFDFKNNELIQINIRYKSIHKSKLPNQSSIEVSQINFKQSESTYEIKHEMDFGFKTCTLYKYKTDTGIIINPDYAEHVRICSKVPTGNNEVASYFKEEPSFRYRQTKEYKLVGIQSKKLKNEEFEIENYKGFEISNGKLNRIIHNRLWGDKKWKEKFDKKMIDFYLNELNIELSAEEKENIGAYNTIHFGIMDEEEYHLIQSRFRKY